MEKERTLMPGSYSLDPVDCPTTSSQGIPHSAVWGFFCTTLVAVDGGGGGGGAAVAAAAHRPSIADYASTPHASAGPLSLHSGHYKQGYTARLPLPIAIEVDQHLRGAGGRLHTGEPQISVLG